MTRFTQKQLKEMVFYGYASDVSNYSCKHHDMLISEEGWLRKLDILQESMVATGYCFKGKKRVNYMR